MINTDNSFAMALLERSASDKSYDAFMEMVKELDLELLGIEAC